MLRLRIAVIILGVLLACAGILSLAKFVSEARTSRSLNNAKDADCLEELRVMRREMAGLQLAIVAAGFFILFGGFLKAQKWAWYAFAVVGGEVFIDVSVLRIVKDAAKADITFSTIGVAMLIAGMLIPTNIFFPKKTRELGE